MMFQVQRRRVNHLHSVRAALWYRDVFVHSDGVPVPSHHLEPQTQLSSFHHLPHPQAPPPHLYPNSQVTSPNNLAHPQVSSPHLHNPQVTSPHYTLQTQATSPHLHHVSSPLLPHPPVTPPHFEPQSQVTSPHLLPQTQVTSPQLPLPQVTSPHLPSSPQLHFSNENLHPGFDHWGRSDPPEASYLQQSFGYQSQPQFSAGLTRDDLQNTHTLSCNAHTLPDCGVYRQVDTPGMIQDTWGPLGSTLPQYECSPMGCTSGGVYAGWTSAEFSSSPSGDFNQFYQDSYHDNSAAQPFCSPNTPGPSPHYPQTPTISSPGPQVHPREERLDFNPQTCRNLSGDQTFSCFLHECDTLPLTSDPYHTGQHLNQNQTELHQTVLLQTSRTSESCFSPQGRGQDVRTAARSAGVPAVPNWRDERGGRGGKRRRGGAGGQTERTTHENITKVLNSRLLCTVCKRDFRSLPALNGHMRSHSGSRAATGTNKVEDSSLLENPSVVMVMPVSMPVQSGGAVKTCKAGQRACSRLSPATGGAVLYRSLLQQEKEEAAVSGDAVVARGDDGGVHYTPPPMMCPLRAGPGLYCSLNTRWQQRAQPVQLHDAHSRLSDVVVMETASPSPGTMTSGNNTPRINVGRSFQAEIPPLRRRRGAHSNSHNALLLWTPVEELEHPENQRRVEALMMMACSSVIPGGGASQETALHVLSECRGDFLRTLERMMATSNNDLTSQQDQSSCWSSTERRLLVKSLQLHHKDFQKVHETVQTKSVPQCVEFYYRWKKKLSLSTRTPAGLTVTLPDTKGQRSSNSHHAR